MKSSVYISYLHKTEVTAFCSYYANDNFVHREQVITFYLSSEGEGFHKETTNKRLRVNAATGSGIFQVTCASYRLSTYNINYCEFFFKFIEPCIMLIAE